MNQGGLWRFNLTRDRNFLPSSSESQFSSPIWNQIRRWFGRSGLRRLSQSVDGIVGRSVGRSVVWLIGWLVGRSVGRSVCWLTSRLFGRSVLRSCDWNHWELGILGIQLSFIGSHRIFRDPVGIGREILSKIPPNMAKKPRLAMYGKKGRSWFRRG